MYSFSFSLPEIKIITRALCCIPRPPPSTNKGQSDTDALILLLTIAQRCVLVTSPPVTTYFLLFLIYDSFQDTPIIMGMMLFVFRNILPCSFFSKSFILSSYNLQKVVPNFSPEHKKKAFKISTKRNSLKLLLCALHQCHYPSSIQWAFQQF